MQSGHKNGHGIHSPYVFDLATNAIFRKEKYRELSALNAYHKSLYRRKTYIDLDDFGAGSRVTDNTRRSISSIAKRSSVSVRQANLLFRICRWYKPSQVIELGTGLGISTRYFASAFPGKPVYTIEGCRSKSEFAKAEAGRDGFEGIHFYVGKFDQFMPEMHDLFGERTCVFIDGDHKYSSTMRYAEYFLGRSDVKEYLMIFDDIYWSEEMEQAWKELAKDERITLSVDLFQFGVLLKRPGMQKQHFKVKF